MARKIRTIVLKTSTLVIIALIASCKRTQTERRIPELVTRLATCVTNSTSEGEVGSKLTEVMDKLTSLSMESSIATETTTPTPETLTKTESYITTDETLVR